MPSAPTGIFRNISGSPFKAVKETKNQPADPENYKVVKLHSHHNYMVLMINYPNCDNYEGNKILVFKDINLIDLINQKLIDPHFVEDNKHITPIARFVPTQLGWEMALKFVEMLDH